MEKKVKALKASNAIGFIACYNGHEIASSTNFDVLTSNIQVKALLGKKGLVIKQTIPEGVIAAY